MQKQARELEVGLEVGKLKIKGYKATLSCWDRSKPIKVQNCRCDVLICEINTGER